MYISALKTYFKEVTISSFEKNRELVELKEIGNSFFIIESKSDTVTNVINFDDLGMSLDIYHKLIVSKQDTDLQ